MTFGTTLVTSIISAFQLRNNVVCMKKALNF
jgi:hypothetical protein